MKYIKYLLFSFGVIGLIVVFLQIYNNKKKMHASDKLSTKEICLLRDGDIILRKGFGFVSERIPKLLKEDYHISHCGVVVSDGNSFRIIHSVSSSLSDFDGVQESSLHRFCKESQQNSIIVVRFRDTNNIPLTAISRHAQLFLNNKIPFDNSFDLEENSKMYCSEMIWKILKDNYQFDIYPEKKYNSVIKFSPFYDTMHFDIIINHNKSITHSFDTK